MRKACMGFLFLFSVLLGKAQLKVGDTPPEISLPNEKDSLVSLSSYKGKIVLIDFWASWCVLCRAANPDVVRLFNKYKEAGFVVFGVSIDSKKAAWLSAIKQDKIKYTQVMDKAGWNSIIAEKYGVSHIPTSFLLDKEGRIVGIDLEGAHLENKLKEIL